MSFGQNSFTVLDCAFYLILFYAIFYTFLYCVYTVQADQQSARSQVNISGRHRGSACVLLNLWQATRTGFKGAQTSSASQCWDNRWGRFRHYKQCMASEKPKCTGLALNIIDTSPSISPLSPLHTLHTLIASKSGSSSAPPTPGYTPYSSFPFWQHLHIGPS